MAAGFYGILGIVAGVLSAEGAATAASTQRGGWLPPKSKAAVYQLPEDFKSPWEREVPRKRRAKPKSISEAASSPLEKKLAEDVTSATAPASPTLGGIDRMRDLSLRVEFNLANIQRRIDELELDQIRAIQEAQEREKLEDLQNDIEFEAAKRLVWEEQLARMEKLARQAEDEFLLILAF